VLGQMHHGVLPKAGDKLFYFFNYSDMGKYIDLCSELLRMPETLETRPLLTPTNFKDGWINSDPPALWMGMKQ